MVWFPTVQHQAPAEDVDDDWAAPNAEDWGEAPTALPTDEEAREEHP